MQKDFRAAHDNEAERLATVEAFIAAHLNRVEGYLARVPVEKRKLDPAGIISDIDGTIFVDGWVSPLDSFLSDAHRAGLPVRIITGGGKFDEDGSRLLKSGADIFPLLRLSNPDYDIVPKPVSPARSNFVLGLVFDDGIINGEPILRELCRDIEESGLILTYADPAEENVQQFLADWKLLSTEQRALALAPWVDLHKRISPDSKPAPTPARTPENF